MKTNFLKSLFNFLKSHNLFQDYESYEDFQVKKYGKSKTSEERFKEFKNNLSKTEQKQFDFIFNEES